MIGRAALLLAATLVQVTLAARFAPALPEPNLVLVLVTAWAWREGGPVAMRWALAGGLLLDLTGTGPFGMHSLCLLGAAYAAGLVGAAAGGGSPVISAAAGAAAALVYSAGVLALADALGLASIRPAEAVALVAGQAAATALLTPVAVCLAGLGRRPLLERAA